MKPDPFPVLGYTNSEENPFYGLMKKIQYRTEEYRVEYPRVGEKSRTYRHLVRDVYAVTAQINSHFVTLKIFRPAFSYVLYRHQEEIVQLR